MSKIMDSLKESKSKVAEGFSQHIILYAKGWYGKGEHILKDLSILLMMYSNSPSPSIGDAKEMLCRTYAEYGSKNSFDLFEAIYEIAGWKWENWSKIGNRAPEQVMIGKLSIIDGEYVDPSQKLNIDF